MNITQQKQQAQLLLQQQRLDEAKTAFEAICRASSRDWESWNLLGAIHGMRGELEDAARCFQKALRIEPNAVGVLNNLGNTLFLLGRSEEAETQYRKALRLMPHYAEALTNLGNLLARKGDAEQAEALYRQALQHNLNHTDAHSNLGKLLHDQGKHAEALECYGRALRLQPQHFDARYNLVSTLLIMRDLANAEAHARTLAQLQPNDPRTWLSLGAVFTQQKRYADAVEALRRATTLNPNHVDAHFNLGLAHRALQDNPSATAALRKTLELDPEHASAAYFLAMLGDAPLPEHSPADYVRKLFDDYADTFEQDLVNNLEYRTPEVLHRIVRDAMEGREASLDIVDLGCGTGLCGKLFRDMASSLTGVDLAPKMIEKARQLGVYDHLLMGDVLEPLQGSEPAYDLILAADVFVYIGNLEEVFAASHEALRPGGLFAFSVEADETQDGYVLRQSGRYGHASAYIRNLAARHGQRELRMQEVVLRKEAGVPMQGYLFVFTKP